MGGAKGSGAQTPGFVSNLANQQRGAAQQISQISQPTQQRGAGQVTDILKTGGAGANIPAIQAAVGGQQRATQQAQSQIGEALSRSGTEGPIGNRILQQVGLMGGQAGAGAQAGMIAPILQQALGLAFGGVPLASGAAGGAAGTQAAGTRLVPPNTVGASRLGGGLGQLASNPQALQALAGLFR